MSNEEKEGTVKLKINDALPAVFADNLAVSTREDDIHFVRFFSALPEGGKEQFRMFVPKANMRRMLDVLCNHCEYFPTKKAVKKKPPAKKKAPTKRVVKPKKAAKKKV